MNTEKDIMATCASAGLALAEVTWRDELLLLRPLAIDDLPIAANLAELGELLKQQTGARWVALDIDSLVEAP